MRSAVRRLALVLVVVGVGLAPAPATAAGYCTTGGVSVVVDFGALGGGIRTGCDATGNRNAAKAFADTGHPLTYAQRQPGFVCRVDAVPQSDPCVNTSPADAYWGLYWSDGTSGWKYSTLGVGSLTVPAGATVAFSWQDGGTADPPGTAPATPPTPTRRPTATTHPTAAATRTPAAAATAATTSAGTATPAATPTGATGTPAPAVTAGPTDAPSPSVAAAGAVTSSSVPAAPGGGGLPWWIPAGVVVALGGATAAVRRTRRARGPR